VNNEYAFEMATSSIRFGWGATREVGMELADWRVRRVMVVTDPLLCRLPQVATVLESLESNGIEARVYDSVRVEPTDESCLEGARFASAGEFDGFVAIGGGSTIDTAKMANLYSTYPPEDFLDYVNPPIGRGLPPPGPLKPLIALPTTAGTGSETTGVAIFDYRKLHAKTGVAHRRLKPTLGILDPENTLTAPPAVAACAGLDVLSHAIESYTALPYTQRPQPDRPVMRPAYQGSNPISDIWSLEALHIVAAYLHRAVEDPTDGEAGEDDSGGFLRRSWFRKRRSAFTARDVLSGVGNGPRVPTVGLCGGASDRSARHVGNPECASRLSLYGAGMSGATFEGSGSSWCRRHENESKGRRQGFSGPYYGIDAATRDAQRLAGNRVSNQRRSYAGARHTAAASRYEALTEAVQRGRVGTNVRRHHGGLVSQRL
jgi:alcohol dehydrogenase class IV